MDALVKKFDSVSIAVLPSVARFNLRVASDGMASASKAFGVKLPSKVGQGAQKGDRAAYCIGPDEWLLHAAEKDQAKIVTAFDSTRGKTPHSLTVISDREIAIGINGPAAAELLSFACPLDLSLMAIGGVKRTVFDYAQVVLIRDSDHEFRIEVWRSFFPHVYGLLKIAIKELSVGI